MKRFTAILAAVALTLLGSCSLFQGPSGADGQDGANGLDGLNGTRTIVLTMYQWAASAPSTFPSGQSTYAWATGTFTAPAAANGWTSLPGAPVAGQTLYECRAFYSDNGASATSQVAWPTSGQVASAVSLAGATGASGSNGGNGLNGANGTRTAVLEMYQWAPAQPTEFPSGTSTYTWSTGAFDAPETLNGWALVPLAAVPGDTLWACRSLYADSGTAPTSQVAWNATVAYAIGAAGTNGSDGAAGTSSAAYYVIPPYGMTALADVNGAIVGINSNVIYTSTDGRTWTSPPTVAVGLQGVAANATTCVVVGAMGSIGLSPASSLSSFSAAPTTNPASSNSNITLQSVAAHGNVFVAVGNNATPGYMLVSSDGQADVWAEYTDNASGILGTTLTYAGYAGGFFFVGSSGGQLYSSADAQAWTHLTDVSLASPIVGVAFGGGEYIVADSLGELMQSADGNVWTTLATPYQIGGMLPMPYAAAGLCYAGDRFAILTWGGSVFMSSDLTSWIFPNAILPSYPLDPKNFSAANRYASMLWVPTLGTGGTFIVGTTPQN